jgi:hypothetical protein
MFHNMDSQRAQNGAGDGGIAHKHSLPKCFKILKLLNLETDITFFDINEKEILGGTYGAAF